MSNFSSNQFLSDFFTIMNIVKLYIPTHLNLISAKNGKKSIGIDGFFSGGGVTKEGWKF